MKLSVQWVASLIDAKVTTAELVEALERAGLEVDGVEPAHRLDENIVVGEILETAQHPNADKLKVCQVLAGEVRYEIVCGAPNVAPGMRVAVAQEGSVLPDGTKITRSELRGVVSQGMLCSSKELGIGDDHSGILDLGAEARIGEPVSSVIGHDDILDIASPAANRWDLLSVLGVAREAAAQLGHPLKRLDHGELHSADNVQREVVIESSEIAPRYTLARFSVAAGRRSPVWMQRRLLAAGMRPVSAVVDITNYVLLETGQPLHAFDAAKVHGRIEVRLAHEGEHIVTLDGVNRQLSTEDVVICDERGPIALGGVMGGLDSEMSDETTEVLFECAVFSAAKSRKTAQRHGLRSEASARYERGVPSQAIDLGVERAIELLKEVAHVDTVSKLADTQDSSNSVVESATLTTVSVDLDWISGRIGLPVRREHLFNALQPLGFVVGGSEGSYSVQVPWWRQDAQLAEDIAEEIVKHLGYDAIPTTLPAYRPDTQHVDRHSSTQWRAKEALRASGLFEVVTYSFIGGEMAAVGGHATDNLLALRNPMHSEQSHLRDRLLPSLLNAASNNRGYADSFGIFEFGRVYLRQGEGELPQEPLRVGAIAVEQGGTDGYAAIKAIWDRLAQSLHVPARFEPLTAEECGTTWYPLRAARVMVADASIGVIGQLHPNITEPLKLSVATGYMELDWQALADGAQIARAVERPKYPRIHRDVSVTLPRSISWQVMRDAITEASIENLAGIDFKTDYYGEHVETGHKVVTLKLAIGSQAGTLTGSDADRVEEHVRRTLAERFDAQ